MEELDTFFFDTYALFEIVHKNKSYEKYTHEITMITTKLNVMELHYALLRLYGKEIAEKAFTKFTEFCVDFTDDEIKEASEFRFKNYKRDLSYIDCLGYTMAIKRGYKFLTGDTQFAHFEDVEFVK